MLAQCAIAAQQGAAMGNLDLDPAQQAVGFLGQGIVGKVAVIAEYRQQVARGIAAGALQQLRAAASGRRVEHAWPGMGKAAAVRAEERHGAHVGLLQGLCGNPFKLRPVLARQAGPGQRCQALGDHPPALEQLGLQLVLLQPGEIAAEHQRHGASRHHGEQQHASPDSKTVQHARSPVSARRWMGRKLPRVSA